MEGGKVRERERERGGGQGLRVRWIGCAVAAITGAKKADKGAEGRFRRAVTLGEIDRREGGEGVTRSRNEVVVST